MFKSFKLFVLEQRLRLHSGKYDAYLNQVRQKGLERDFPRGYTLPGFVARA